MKGLCARSGFLVRLPDPPPPHPGLYRASRATLGLSGWNQRRCQGPDLVGAIGIRQAVSRWAPLGGTRGSARDRPLPHRPEPGGPDLVGLLWVVPERVPRPSQKRGIQASRPWLMAARVDLRGTYNLALNTHMAERRALHEHSAHILQCIHTKARNWLRLWHHING